MNDTRLSKFLSLVLRHKPETIGITLDPSGWVRVDELLEKLNRAGRGVSRGQLERLVLHNDKQRFAFSRDGSKIRANQGHSVAIDLDLPPRIPPPRLYHGTARRFLPAIREQGLSKGSRQHVHLSADEATAGKVGRRHGEPVVLSVAAGRMHEDGYVFYRSENGIWLTESVPVRYLELSVGS